MRSASCDEATQGAAPAAGTIGSGGTAVSGPANTVGAAGGAVLGAAVGAPGAGAAIGAAGGAVVGYQARAYAKLVLA